MSLLSEPGEARHILPGAPHPMGVSFDGEGANIAVFSAHAERVEICLFAESGLEIARLALPGRTGDLHHGFIPGLKPGFHYGLRAHGSFDPAEGHRFDPSKLLIDPYATCLTGPIAFAEPLAEFGTDTARLMPKCVALEPLPPISADERPQTPWTRTVVYEAHVKGLTKLWPGTAPDIAGTVEALATDPVIEHLTGLGITAIELLPIQALADEPHLVRKALRNFWGYNSANFFAPEPRYMGPGGVEGLRRTVKRLHAAGIEVILDVVLNHSAEGDGNGPWLSFRGLDNRSYYRQHAAREDFYSNETGCGNALDMSSPAMKRLGLDALRWWASRIGVDGFRFDLAPTLDRDDAAFFEAVLADPELGGLKIIVEPWDIGPDGYRVGDFQPGIAEWNDQFRDRIRQFWRGDAGAHGALADGLLGSARIFDKDHRPAWTSVNFVACHDGFTLADLTRYAGKHNEANGEGNRDGHGENSSDNMGVEGATDDPELIARRNRRASAMLATALLAQGTPMLRAGDEIGQSQQGNNNAYCQDNEINWIDWSAADCALQALTSQIVKLRQSEPVLRQANFLHGAARADGLPECAWFGFDGAAPDWEDPALAGLCLLLRDAGLSGDPPARSVLIAFNRGEDDLALTLPEEPGHDWRLALSTVGQTEASPLAGQSLAAFVAEPAATARPRKPMREAAAPESAVASLARWAGIVPEYHQIDGSRHVCGPETRAALLGAMGLPADEEGARDALAAFGDRTETHGLPREIIATAGLASELPVDGWKLSLEGGEVIEGDGSRLPPLPLGVHGLETDRGEALLISAPRKAPSIHEFASAHGPIWGVTAPLYGLTSGRTLGFGDYEDLAAAAEALGGHGAAFLGINPVHAMGAADQNTSPYSPSSRGGLSTRHIAFDKLPEFAASSEAQALVSGQADAVAAARSAEFVDYELRFGMEEMLFEALYTAFKTGPEARQTAFTEWLATKDDKAHLQAVFETLSLEHGCDWRFWPGELQDIRSPAIAEFRAAKADRIRHHEWRQWLAEQQLSEAQRRAKAAGMAAGLYLDIAVGVRPGGAETWASPEAFARNVSLGAPPDLLNAQGQRWDLAPLSPIGLADTQYAAFRTMLRTAMARAGIVRIDHVIGLMRSFWSPEGGIPGAYVTYPRKVLMALVRLEAARHACMVVGEDLGTVPEGLREDLDASGLLGCTIMGFEREKGEIIPPGQHRRSTLASFGSHDLPSLAGWWEEKDVDTRLALGHMTEAEAAIMRCDRTADRLRLARLMEEAGLLPEEWRIAGMTSEEASALLNRPFDAGLGDALHALLCQSNAELIAISLDDVFAVREQQNVPGTVWEAPNWKRRAPVAIEDLAEAPDLVRLAALLNERTGRADATDGQTE